MSATSDTTSSTTSIAQLITDRLADSLVPDYLDVVNESHRHNVPAGSESHFKVTVVAAGFHGKRLLQRHRQINGLLEDVLAGPVHALALHTYTADEWQARFGAVPDSPHCRGGDGGDGGERG